MTFPIPFLSFNGVYLTLKCETLVSKTTVWCDSQMARDSFSADPCFLLSCFFKQSECILYLNFIIGFKQVVFEGIRGNSFTGDIALDDITFTVGMANCSLQPFDALPPGMTTAPPTVLTPTTIGK